MRNVSLVISLAFLLAAVGQRELWAASWQTNGPLAGLTINAIAVDPTNPDTIYIGTEYSGLWKSEDRGLTWTPRNHGRIWSAVTSIVIDPITPTTLYIAEPFGVSKSSDGGASWLRVISGLPTGQTIQTLAIHPTSPETLLAASEVLGGGGVFKTTDGAANWTSASNGLPAGVSITSLLIDHFDPRIIYAGGATDRVYKSMDEGATWIGIGSSLPNLVQSLAIDSGNPSIAYAGVTSKGVYKSTDAGGSWALASSGLADTPWVLVVDPTSPSTLFAGTNAGVYRSVNGGQQWTRLTTGIPTNRRALALGLDDRPTPTVYAGTFSGLYATSDLGATWNKASRTIGAPIRRLAVHPLDHAVVYAAGDGPNVFKTEDGGASWSEIGASLSVFQIFAVAVDPSSLTTAYIATDQGIFKTANGGATWEAKNQGLPTFQLNVGAVVIDFVTPTTLYAMVGSFGSGSIFKSTNGGTSWSESGGGLLGFATGLTMDPHNPKTLFTSAEGGLFRSSDGGATWVRLGSGVGGPIVIDPRTPTTMYVPFQAFIASGGIWRSVDGGSTWGAMITDLPKLSSPSFLAIDPVDSARLYVSLYRQGVYESRDSGASWVPLGDGLPEGTPTGLSGELIVDAVTKRLHLAGDYGMYSLSLGPRAPTIDGKPANPSSASPATFTFSSVDSGAGFECGLDGGPLISCASPYVSGPLAVGTHTFVVIARDANGDRSPATSYTWTVRATPLTVITLVVNDNGGSAKPSDFAVTVSGASPSPGTFAGVGSPGVDVMIGVGAYNVAVSGPGGYTHGSSADCAGTIAAGDVRICTIRIDDSEGWVSYGVALAAEVGEAGGRTEYVFQGNAGETIIVQAARQSGGKACVEIVRRDGTRVVGKACGARPSMVLDQSGVHFIYVSEEGDNETLGYTLALERISPPSPGTRVVRDGESVISQLTPAGALDLYTFRGIAGEGISIDLIRNSGGVPCLELFRPDGTQMGYSECLLVLLCHKNDDSPGG